MAGGPRPIGAHPAPSPQGASTQRLTKKASDWNDQLMRYVFFATSLFLTLSAVMAQSTDWSRQAEIPPGENRANILNLPAEQQAASVQRGRVHVFSYPVTVTELTIPYRPFMQFFESRGEDPFRRWLISLSQDLAGFHSPTDVMNWLGLHPFADDDTTPVRPEERALGMGATVMEREGAEVLTFSCAACHSAELFGKKVVGLTNRFPRANAFFLAGKQFLPLLQPGIFQALTHATPAELATFKRSRTAIQYVGAKKPQVLGLDTSLAQVALSLSRRGLDDYATRFIQNARHPRPNALEKDVADSKPAVWWNVKYKTRWLSDGSIVQGNPVLTNFLWNEIGRGVDLRALEGWMTNNRSLINDLTAAVFATEAPAYLDFLPEDTLDISMARRGQVHFENHCMSCHGRYEKAWEHQDASASKRQLAQTTKLTYHTHTPVFNVGTDPGRYRGMRAFAQDLNRLQISKSIQTIVEPQEGYVPPPLIGIWARWPYFHNNSAPSLCAVLTAGTHRPAKYVAGPAVDPDKDFDSDCVGYPVVSKAPAAWKKNQEYWYDTTREGLSNRGHDEGIFLRDGAELMTPEQKRELIEFLKTL